ncbi:histidine kinase [Olivibacter sp. SDN3]|uniref:histidine kinase n=1 Tax=Olivibacter sp. SDN3 TaxID=2764720 RepID=UPI0016512DF3|nr:histidine kinase [Olivibacter sp. SDN3]QNL50630.1 histidine kinase [Olivibacter sp. SDN3]
MLPKLSQQDQFATVEELIRRQQLDEAFTLLDSLLDEGKKHANQWLMGRAYAGIGNVLLVKREFDQALRHYLLSLKYLNLSEYPQDVVKVYANMGTLYSTLKQFALAEEYLLKALRHNPDENDDKLKSLANLGGVYLERGKREAALKVFNEAIELAQSLKNRQVEAVLYTNLSNYFIEEKKWRSAIDAAQNSIRLREFLNQPISVITWNNLGYAQVQIGEVKQGIKHYEQALEDADLREEQQLLFNLYQAHKRLGNYQRTWEYIEAYDRVKDSLSVLNFEEKVAELNTIHESSERQRQIETLAAENTSQKKQLRQQAYLILAIGVILLLIMALLFFSWKHFKVKEALEKSQMKHRFLLLQLNPHFIFNALQSVQHFIYKNDQQQSMEYLNNFSRLIRLVLENSETEMIPLDEEIEILDNYLRLQQLNCTPAFSYTIKVDERIESEDMLVPTMLLQPFVENAVEHGVKGHPNGLIELIFERSNETLEILIKDNGKGFPAEQEKQKNLHKSMSMEILNKRIAELNKIGKWKIELKVFSDLENDNFTGTCVHFFISA